MAQTLDKFIVRLPDGMRDHLKEAAASNNRSMNAEIVARMHATSMTLRDYFAGQAIVGVLIAQETSGSVTKLADVMQGVRAGGHEARTAYAIADAMLAERHK